MKRLAYLAGAVLLLGTSVFTQNGPPTSCQTTDKDCKVHADCNDNVAGNMGRCDSDSGKCCDVSVAGGPGDDLPDLTNPCPGFAPDMSMDCRNLTSCVPSNANCGKDKACCLAGTCENRCLPDLSICVNTSRILAAVLSNVNCFNIIQNVIGAPDIDVYCSSLIGGLMCAANELMQPPYSDMCIRRMVAFIKISPTVIFDEISKYMPGAAINQDFVKRSGTCQAQGTDDDDEDWNSSCPKLNDGGLCPTDCTMDSDCSGNKMVCCNVGGEQCHKCMPDLKQCGDISQIFGNPMVAQCMPQIQLLESVTNYDNYCSTVWNMFKCLAGKIMPAGEKLCLERMAMFVQRSPGTIFTGLQTMLSLTPSQLHKLRKYVTETTSCKGSPLYMPPERPVPEDVKVCFNEQKITNAAAQCGRLTGSAATNQACGNLEMLVECIAEKIITAEDENTRRKCAGEIYEFVGEHREKLSNIVGNLDPKACGERSSVCGGDLQPLDQDCTSSNCPVGYDCKSGFCCPQEKAGWCPKFEPGQRPICKQECKMDGQCENDEKCCNSVGCGYRTCMKMETGNGNKSKCEMLFEAGKSQLQKQGICGNGTTLIKLPRCQNLRFSPVQFMKETGRGYCVFENGTKINGSDFEGNRDCTKVREGKCPAPPSQCPRVDQIADTCQSNDHRCSAGQKCCTFYEGGECLKKCVTALKAPETVQDDCQDRKCCPLTLCQDKICLKDKTAVCRINSCGGCNAEFYNLAGEKVNCNEGVSVCERARETAREINARRRKSDYDRIASFTDTRDKNEREMRSGAGNANNDNEMTDSDMKEEKEDKMDEYGIERYNKDELEEDGMDDMEEMENMQERMAAISKRLCSIVDKLKICQNGGECKIGSGESFWEVCKCTNGYSGLFCDTVGTVKPLDTQCNRDSNRVKTFLSIMMGADHVEKKTILEEIMNKMKPPQNILTQFSCDSGTGKYTQMQMGMMLPKTINSVNIYYCVDTNTGVRKEGTPVTLAESGHMPNCDIMNALPDIMRLPRRCMSANMSICASTDKCQFYWNQETGMCEKGKAVNGFSTLTECYEHCAIHRGCINEPEGEMVRGEDFVCEMGIISGPKPCRMTDQNVEMDTCDYDRQFCDVMENTTGQTGTCKAFPSYCLESPDSGFGDRSIGAYYYNAKIRKCMKFDYSGNGGNRNRFYSLHQCHTECSTRHYKFDDTVCPVPKMLAMSMMTMIDQDMCDDDNDCPDEEVCCSTGKTRICTSHLRTCFTSVRCSLYGSCSQGSCVCDSCSNTPMSEVCGSDGKTYDNLCQLKKRSCEMMQNITVAFNGSCKTKCGDAYCENYETCENNVCKCGDSCITQYLPVCGKNVKTGMLCSFSNECEMHKKACQMKQIFVKVKDDLCNPQDSDGSCMLPCTKEYRPICTYDTTDTVPKLVTIGNPCLLKNALLNGKMIKVLYPGECKQTCGSENCELYEVCSNNTCTCQKGCTREYRPVCAHPISNDAKMITFPNICLMKQQACKEQKAYVITVHGPCKNPEPVNECPQTRADIPYSAIAECRIEKNEGCDTENGEMCCPYGAGRKCLPKKALVRRKMMKEGLCPVLSGINYDMDSCKESNCTSDDDCAGETKCCGNNVCGHMTCIAPLVRGDESPCGSTARMVSQCTPNTDVTGCPTGGTCKTVTTLENEKVGVCCVPNEQLTNENAENELLGSKFCHLMEISGLTCENGGTCIGDVRNGKVCQCMDGNFGPFCRGKPPAEPCNQVECVTNPCDVTTCPGVPEAKCQANYCGGCNAIFNNGSDEVTHLCHATPCLVQKAVMMTLGQKVFHDDMPTEDEMNMRKRRELVPPMEGDDGEMDDEANPFKKMFLHLMDKMGLRGIPMNIDQLCASDGNFRSEQCARGMMEDSHHCYCVDRHTGTPIPNGPRENSLAVLNCSDLSADNMGLQDFCLSELPSKEICGETVTGRFYFNAKTMDCEMFSDYGCNIDVKNNFANYKTCASACGVRSTVLSRCAAVRCGFGTQCVIKDGSATCVDPDEINVMFEPVCDSDGMFHPKQCNGDMCRCVNPDTGDVIANSDAEGRNLKCLKDEAMVKAIRTKSTVCEGNKQAQFCENGGDRCKTCQLQDNQQGQRAEDNKVNDQNVCISCQTCPAGQNKQSCNTENLCKSTCKEFPEANCRINTCACKEEYVANDRVVNCQAVQSQCEKEKHRAKLQEISQKIKNNGKMPENSKQIRCSSSGTYYAVCEGNQCQCLNATNGERVDNRQTGRTIDNIDCGSVQRRTKAERMVVELNFPMGRLNEMSESKREKFKTQLKNTIEKRSSLILEKILLRSGSIIAEVDVKLCEQDCIVTSETEDLASVVNTLKSEVNSGDLTVVVEGESFAASTAVITDVTTTEELEGPVTEETPEDDDNKTTIIIVVVVVIVVVIVAVAIAFYCYKKANKSKTKDIPFSDIQGKSNPAYNKA